MPSNYDTEAAGVILIDPEGNVIAQLRDNKPTINEPGLASFFGGAMELGESPLQGALRELREETNLDLAPNDLQPFTSGVVLRTVDGQRELRHIFIAKNINPNGLTVYEGQGIYIVKDRNDPLITPTMKATFDKWFDERDAN